MADPQRLLSQISDANEFERELLGSLRQVEPPANAKGEAWARLSAQVTAVGLVGVGATHASTGAAATLAPLTTKLLAGKLVIGLALAGSVLGASALWVEFGSRSAPASASATTPAARAPMPVESVPTVLEPAAAEAPPRFSTPTTDRPSKPSPEPTPSDRLSAESALLTQARAQLRSGDAVAAQQSLTRLRNHFPNGVLGQEREVLAIEVLAARGNLEAARRRARAFIALYPKSPHSAQLSRFADAP